MILSVLAAFAFAQMQAGQTFSWYEIPEPNSVESRISYAVAQERLDPPKYSPKKFGTDDPQPFEFDWMVAGYGKPLGGGNKDLRFRVFSQERKPTGDIAPMVARQLLQVWDLLQKRYEFDHPDAFGRLVDVYLCWGGTPGGEQRFEIDNEGKPPRERKADVIYIYDLSSFTKPVEMAREVAHEYGHAVLPSVGGFKTPEDWGNGYLGEKLFLRWLRNEMANGNLTPDDAMGASKEGLDRWVKLNVDPLMMRAAQNGPEFGLLEGEGQTSMDVFNGLVCYADWILPPSVVGRSLKLIGSTRAQDYPAALVEACREKGRVVVGIPKELEGKPLWLPLGSGKLSSGQVVKKNGDWALVKPGLTSLTLIYS